MTLPAGTRLGPFEVTGSPGAGGISNEATPGGERFLMTGPADDQDLMACIRVVLNRGAEPSRLVDAAP